MSGEYGDGMSGHFTDAAQRQGFVGKTLSRAEYYEWQREKAALESRITTLTEMVRIYEATLKNLAAGGHGYANPAGTQAHAALAEAHKLIEERGR